MILAQFCQILQRSQYINRTVQVRNFLKSQIGSWLSEFQKAHPLKRLVVVIIYTNLIKEFHTDFRVEKNY